jgi:hypothetical protein
MQNKFQMWKEIVKNPVQCNTARDIVVDWEEERNSMMTAVMLLETERDGLRKEIEELRNNTLPDLELVQPEFDDFIQENVDASEDTGYEQV